jgi:hypothetical protein
MQMVVNPQLRFFVAIVEMRMKALVAAHSPLWPLCCRNVQWERAVDGYQTVSSSRRVSMTAGKRLSIPPIRGKQGGDRCRGLELELFVCVVSIFGNDVGELRRRPFHDCGHPRLGAWWRNASQWLGVLVCIFARSRELLFGHPTLKRTAERDELKSRPQMKK